MIWIGIAIGIIFTSVFGMTLLVIGSRQKASPIPPELKIYWEQSLRLQRLLIDALDNIEDAIEEKK